MAILVTTAAALIVGTIYLVASKSDVAGGRSPAVRGCDSASPSCAAESVAAEAEAMCQPEIERSAEYGFRWKTGWTEPMFKRVRWLNESAGTVTLIGDGAEAQNQFGAYFNVVYWCNFDSIGKRVISATFERGRLPANN